jgi:hypothetical protein
MASAAARADARMEERAVEPKLPLEDLIPGREVETPHGRHYESERHFPHYDRHGNMEISRLSSLPHDFLHEITEGAVPAARPESWAFLDTETTGLAGGSGTCAFLVGIGRITPAGFRIRQFFMRDYPEEPSQLHAVTEALGDARVLVTYNGKSFDIPLLETRFRMCRHRPPFDAIPHLDLLHGARRLWRLRFESCKLTELESRILGHEREGDISGELIPQVYFDYVRHGRAARLAPVFRHNAFDILSLACLTGIVPWAFREQAADHLKHASELVAFARYLRQSGRLEEARTLFRRALKGNLTDELAYKTMWDLAELEKKLRSPEVAVLLHQDLASIDNPHRGGALVELAKYHEHKEKDYARALDLTASALAIADSPELRRRRARLEQRLRKPRSL